MHKRKLLIGAALAAGAFLYIKGRTVSIPKGAVAVKPFKLKKYLGTWYEIARMDYRFERNMKNVSATYSLKPNGEVKVDNKGYDTALHQWKESVGKAKFVKDKTEARFMVSFFPFIYAGYNVIDIDDTYENALVVGDDLHYIWILSRGTTISAEMKERFLDKARSLGYVTEDLIWTTHDQQA